MCHHQKNEAWRDTKALIRGFVDLAPRYSFEMSVKTALVTAVAVALVTAMALVAAVAVALVTSPEADEIFTAKVRGDTLRCGHAPSSSTAIVAVVSLPLSLPLPLPTVFHKRHGS